MHGFRDNEVLLQARYDVIMISPPGGAARNFLISDSEERPRFYISLVLHCNYTSVVHRFRFNELFMFAGNDVIAISSLWGASGNFLILKGRPQLYIDDQFLSILNGLDVIRYFLFGWDFLTGGESLGILGQNDPQNVKWVKNTFWEVTSSRQTASFEPLCVKLSICVWPVVRKKKRKEGRKVPRSIYFTYAWSNP